MSTEKRAKRMTSPNREEQERDNRSARTAKSLRDKIREAEAGIKRIRERYPGKSLIQNLVRFREVGALAEWLVILRIEKNQGGSLLGDDGMFLEEQKIILRQKHPGVEEELKEYLKR